jgi:Subtilase family
MTSGSLRTTAVLGGLALALTSVSCADRLPTSPVSPESVGGTRMSGEFECTVEVASHQLVCTPAGPSTAPGISLALLGQNQIKLTSSNVAYDTTTLIFSFDVTLKNLLAEPIGTPDGVTVAGSKVFYESGPTATSYYSAGDTGTVTVHNADGEGNFTRAKQPYHFYDQILAPSEVSPAKSWELRIPRSVATFSFVVRVFTYMVNEPGVPMTPPDGIPSWFFTAGNAFACTGLVAGTCVRDVVTLVFQPEATQEERLSAVNAVGGTVVGGDEFIGDYYVRIGGDRSLTTLEGAIAKLQSLPQVQEATTFQTNTLFLNYLRPKDGPGFQDWRLLADSADGENWALEAIGAPNAWGCGTGESTFPVAVIDNGFRGISDLTDNVSFSEGLDVFPQSRDHGTSVAAVVAARGNNSTLVTGVMWNASLRLYDVNISNSGAVQDFTWAEAFRKLRVASLQGARVVNMSMGINWWDLYTPGYNPANETDPVKDRANRRLVRDVHSRFRRVMNGLAAQGIRPLVVLSAGNDAIDAEWNGATAAADLLPDQVLVVGSHNVNRASSASFSNHGHLVQVLAPGENPYVLRGNATVDNTQSGTSFSAPHVTGLAGLLGSFHPTLTSGEIKQLIIDGATRDQPAGSLPIINAYRSLKIAAERNGAPLCGNRVWASGAQIYAQRGSGAPEALGPAETSGEVGDILTQHGGRVILYNSTSGQGRALHRQTDGTWQLGGVPTDYNTKIGGATWSVRAYSHGADSLVQLNTSGVNNNSWWRTGSQTTVPVILRTVQNPNGSQLGTLPITDLPLPETRICVERVPNGACTYTMISGRYWLSRVAYPQAYQPVLITVSPVNIAFVDSTAWRTCGYDPGLQCRNARSGLQWSATKVYKMPITGGTPALVDTLPGTVLWIGQTEVAGSDTLVMGRGTWIIQNWFDPETGDQPTTDELTSCAIEYRSLSTLATVGQQIANQKTCGLSSFTVPDNHGGGSFSPNRAPSAPNGVTPRVPRERRIEFRDLVRAESTRRD